MAAISRLGWSVYTAAHMMGQSRAAFRPLPAIVRAQSRRVRAAVAHAYRTVPYYRETMHARGLDPGDFSCAADLHLKLPLLEREQLKRDPDYFVSTARRLSSYREVHSSGSTGAPLTAYWDWPAHFRSVAYADRWREAGVGGRFGRRTTVISAAGASLRAGQAFNRKAALVPDFMAAQRQDLSIESSPARNVELINDFRPHVLGSYGSYLEALFLYLQRSGAQMHRPDVVVYGADNLSATARTLIGERWGARVVSVYQAVEVANVGFDCGEGMGLHVNVDLCPVTIMNSGGSLAPPGEPGEVVVSNLVNRATVLLNYRLGDLASVRPEACRCGRTLPLLSYVEGRSDDWIYRASGERVHPLLVCQLFRGDRDVWQFQVVQSAVGRLDVAIVLVPGADPARIAERLLTRLRALVGDGSRVDVRFTDEIVPGPTGKIRAVVSRVEAAAADAER